MGRGNWNSGRRPRPPVDIKMVRGQVKDTRWKKTTMGTLFDSPPADIEDDPDALKEWERVVPILRAAGWVGDTELNALVTLCHQWSIYVQAHKGVKTEGLVVLRPSGAEFPNPHLRVMDNALHQCRQLWTELGLTPAGRARLAGGPTAPLQKQSKWAGLLT